MSLGHYCNKNPMYLMDKRGFGPLGSLLQNQPRKLLNIQHIITASRCPWKCVFWKGRLAPQWMIESANRRHLLQQGGQVILAA